MWNNDRHVGEQLGEEIVSHSLMKGGIEVASTVLTLVVINNVHVACLNSVIL